MPSPVGTGHRDMIGGAHSRLRIQIPLAQYCGRGAAVVTGICQPGTPAQRLTPAGTTARAAGCACDSSVGRRNARIRRLCPACAAKERVDEVKKRSEVVVITGASAGLGRAIACAFAKRGASIGLIARGGAGMAGLEAAAREVEDLGGHALVLPADVAKPDEIENAAGRVELELGPIDVWVNNAMTSVFAPLSDITADEFRRVTEVTYLGQVYGTMAALKRMRPRNAGSVVLVGSALAYRGIPLQSAYCGAKHAIQGFADSVRTELLHDKSDVRICMVQMPAMNTPQFSWTANKLPNNPQPVPPIYQPEVGAKAVYWAAHHRRREIFVGKPTVTAILGNKIAPQLGDWYLSRTGYEAQQTGEPAENQPSNLWEPLPGDHGAHGPFDDRALALSAQAGLSLNRKWIFAGAGIIGLLAAGVVYRRQSGGNS